MNAANLEALAQLVAQHEGTRPNATLRLTPLRGGAIQENWLVSITGHAIEYVLRTDATATIRSSHTREQEFALVKAAHEAGVRVARPILYCEDTSIFAKPFALYEKMPGTALGSRIVKDLSLGGDRRELARTLGRELAMTHRIEPGHRGLDFLGERPDDPARIHVAHLRAALDALGTKRPALEWGLRWLELHLPPAKRVTLLHSDYRTGNYLVDARGLTAILDWEFSHWGDPYFDLAWFCAKCWRFGRNEREAGGIGAREDFYEGYESESGESIDREAVAAYEVLAHARWAVIALEQGERHISGREPSLELALTGRMVAELEYELVRMSAPERWRAA